MVNRWMGHSGGVGCAVQARLPCSQQAPAGQRVSSARGLSHSSLWLKGCVSLWQRLHCPGRGKVWAMPRGHWALPGCCVYGAELSVSGWPLGGRSSEPQGPEPCWLYSSAPSDPSHGMRSPGCAQHTCVYGTASTMALAGLYLSLWP